jgi:hypothetical protein
MEKLCPPQQRRNSRHSRDANLRTRAHAIQREQIRGEAATAIEPTMAMRTKQTPTDGVTHKLSGATRARYDTTPRCTRSTSNRRRRETMRVTTNERLAITRPFVSPSANSFACARHVDFL